VGRNPATVKDLRYRGRVPGAVLIVIAMVLVLPVAIMLGGALWSAIIGWLATEDAEGKPE
jgi:hypothetical protein